MSYVFAKVICLKCGEEMQRQGDRIYFCFTCAKFYRLKTMIPVYEEATLAEAQKAIAEKVAEDGLAELAD